MSNSPCFNCEKEQEECLHCEFFMIDEDELMNEDEMLDMDLLEDVFDDDEYEDDFEDFVWEGDDEDS